MQRLGKPKKVSHSVEYYEGKIDTIDEVVEYMQTYKSLSIDIPFYQWLTTVCLTERACAVKMQENILADMEQSQAARE